ncbi:MAG: FprA family A-type flavoprotein [Clostridiaceae bacterium]|nr:FprA family A-type flavoprotein [Clostridiaceae bacterium]
MDCVRKIAEDIFWVGANERHNPFFENIYPVPQGYSCNSYLILDEKAVLTDTVGPDLGELFFGNIDHVLGNRQLDYVIVNHMEPDHCSMLGRLAEKYPDAIFVGNQKTLTMAGQFFDERLQSRFVIVKEGDSLSIGKRTLRFYMAPMVHWPETMVTYDETAHILYSADAFGTFGAINGNIFADEAAFDMDSARIYYTNIVGKYGLQTAALLNKMEGMSIEMLCPLHGPVWRDNISVFTDKYELWSRYEPEERAVVIAYASIYGNTEHAAEKLAFKLGELGVKGIKLYDLSRVDPSKVLAEAFRCSHLVLASSTYNNGLFTPMEILLNDLKAHNFQNRTAAVIENGTWAPAAGKLMIEALSCMKNITVLREPISIKSSLKEQGAQTIDDLAGEISRSLSQ